MEDPFEKRNAEKKLVAAKQKMRELRNKAESIGEKLPFGIFGTPNRVSQRGKAGLKEVGKRAATSTASVGKFDREVEENFPKETFQILSKDFQSPIVQFLTPKSSKLYRISRISFKI